MKPCNCFMYVRYMCLCKTTSVICKNSPNVYCDLQELPEGNPRQYSEAKSKNKQFMDVLKNAAETKEALWMKRKEK